MITVQNGTEHFILTDSEIATIKAALDIASDWWESKIVTTNNDTIRDMAYEQQAQHNALAKRIEQEVW